MACLCLRKQAQVEYQNEISLRQTDADQGEGEDATTQSCQAFPTLHE